MRHPIWKKEDFFFDGTLRKDMSSEVVEIPDREIQIYGVFYSESPPLGHTTDIQVEDGTISGEVTWFQQSYDGLIKDKLIRLAGHYDQVEMDGNTVIKARLRSIALIANESVPSGANPGAVDKPYEVYEPAKDDEEKTHAMYFDKEASEPGTGVVACTCGDTHSSKRPEKLAKWMKRHAAQTGHTKVMGS